MIREIDFEKIDDLEELTLNEIEKIENKLKTKELKKFESLHIFSANREDNFDWEKGLFFDIETVKDMEEYYYSKETEGEEKLKYLNPLNVKWIGCLYIYKRYIPSSNFVKVKKEKNLIYVQNKKVISTKEDLLKFILIMLNIYYKNDLSFIAAFNGNNFDFIIFQAFPKLFDIEFKKKNYYLILKDNLLKRLKIKKLKIKKQIKLVDLIKIAKASGASSLDEFAKIYVEDKKNIKAKKIEDYLYQDVFLLYKIAKKLKELNINETPTKTAKIYLIKELRKKGYDYIKYINNILLVKDYAGGKTTTFYHKAENVNHFDANSLYPSAMAYLNYPVTNDYIYLNKEQKKCKKVKFIKDKEIDVEVANEYLKLFNKKLLKEFLKLDYKNFIKKIVEVYEDFFIVNVKIKDVNKNITKNDKKLEFLLKHYFPFSFRTRDNRRAHVFVKDYIYQVQFYECFFLIFYDYEIISAYTYKAEKYIFADIYKKLYELRKIAKQKGDKKQLLYKIIMNSSYGILGTNEKEISKCLYKLEELEDEIKSYYMKNKAFLTFKKARKITIDEEEKELAILRNVLSGDKIYLDLKDENSKFNYFYTKKYLFETIPIHAIATTSHARFLLNLMIFHLIFLDKKVYYCDTDSVITNATKEDIKSINAFGDNLLEWKQEYENIERAYFIAPKIYFYGENNKLILMKAKGTGNELSKEIIFNSIKINKRQAKIEPKLIKRNAFDIDSIPIKYPDQNFLSVFNKDKLPFKIAFKHLFLDMLNYFKNEKIFENELIQQIIN